MMGLKVEIAVFVETNLGTRFVIPISLHFTAAHLKREIERAHSDIFPELGFVSVHALMVKRNSHFYRLPDSFCLKHACQGFGNFWLLHADTSLLKTLEKTCLLGSVVSEKVDDSRNKKHRRKRFVCPLDSDTQKVDDPAEVSNSHAVTETPSEVMSVSGIISRYFTDFIELGHVGSALCPETSVRFGQNLQEGQFWKKPPLSEELSSVGFRRYDRSEVGKRLVTASNSLSLCQNSHASSLSKGKRLWAPDASSVVRNLVFEIDDND
ncbi:hypothetical protein RND81_12G185700 [Saponaria officinalis]|uniref:Uncharacterized protein n=1 Tax=Saponaria officinalis TaxID=3572 RepID=A0AAW1HCE5_SAPOF